MHTLKHRKPWSRSNPSPASLLMLSLGGPTDYSSEQVRRTTLTPKQAKTRERSIFARMARRIARMLRE